jgi:hypothetical protein
MGNSRAIDAGTGPLDRATPLSLELQVPTKSEWMKGAVIALAVIAIVSYVGPIRRIVMPDAPKFGA